MLATLLLLKGKLTRCELQFGPLQNEGLLLEFGVPLASFPEETNDVLQQTHLLPLQLHQVLTAFAAVKCDNVNVTVEAVAVEAVSGWAVTVEAVAFAVEAVAVEVDW